VELWCISPQAFQGTEDIFCLIKVLVAKRKSIKRARNAEAAFTLNSTVKDLTSTEMVFAKIVFLGLLAFVAKSSGQALGQVTVGNATVMR